MSKHAVVYRSQVVYNTVEEEDRQNNRLWKTCDEKLG